MAVLRWETAVSFPFVRLEYTTADDPMQERLPRQSPGELLVKTVGPRELRKWTWPQDLTLAEKQSAEAFLRLIDYRRVAFFLKDPKDYARTGVAMTLVSGLTYRLPTTGIEAGDYPIDDANLQMYDGGAPAAHASVDQEARTVTLSGAPGGAVTADYWYERLVKLTDVVPMNGQSINWYGFAPSFEEIIDAV